MNIYELKRLADRWDTISHAGFHAQWPASWPKAERNVDYMDKCKAASVEFNLHCQKHFMEALEVLKLIEQLGALRGGYLSAESTDSIFARLQTTIKRFEEVNP